MSQPQELPSHNPAHEVPVHVQAPGQYQYFPPPASQPPGPEYVSIPAQTPAPHSTAPVSPQFNFPPLQTYGSPDQYGSHAPPLQPPQQVPQEYYQQPVQGQYDAEKGGVPAYIPPQGDGTSAPALAPPVEGTAGSGAAPPAMITLFGKKFTKKAIIITAILIFVILIFVIGLGAGLGAKGKKNKKKNKIGCSGCNCFTDPQDYRDCMYLKTKVFI